MLMTIREYGELSARVRNNAIRSFRPYLLIISTAIMMLAAGTANAGLIGTTVTASSTGEGIVCPDNATSCSATIGDGPEFEFLEFVSIGGELFDFGDSSLTVSPATEGNFFWTLSVNPFVVFSGFEVPITGLSIISNNGYSGDILSGFSFTPDSITLLMGQSAREGSDAALVFGISLGSASPVPAPAPLLLLGFGLAGLVWSRRRKA